MSRALQPVGPRECAFLITVPSARNEFLSDLNGSDHDFLRSYFHNFGPDFDSLPPEAKWEVFEPEAKEIARAVKVLRGIGFHIRPRATAADLASVMTRYPVVILFTHWRSDFFQPSDICDGIAVRRLLDESPASTKLLADSAVGSDPVILAGALNSLLKEMSSTAQAEYKARGSLPPSDLVLLKNARSSLNERMPQAVKGGGAIEFCDGMYSAAELVSLLPPEFAGVVDLSVCNSLLLAEEIRRKCPNCLVVATESAADLRFHLNYYVGLAAMIRTPAPFLDVSTRLRRSILQQLAASNAKQL